MVSEDRYDLSKEANQAIQQALNERIPYVEIAHSDENPKFVSQLDLFGHTDLIVGFGSTKTYNLQNKSRSSKPGYNDICIECIAYKGNVTDPDTKTIIPISGAYYYEKDKVWLIPKLAACDGISVYLKNRGQVYNFARYYLDILFSYPGVWDAAMTGAKQMDTDTMRCVYCVYFNPDKFIDLYLHCVTYVVTGEGSGEDSTDAYES
jgi:hypothetical protein